MTRKRFFAAATTLGTLVAMAASPLRAQQPLVPPTGTSMRPTPAPARPVAPNAPPELIQAREFVTQQKWAEASNLIEAGLQKRPRDPQWRFLQGVLFAETGKTKEAIGIFELLTEDFPELSEPFNNLAALYVDQNELHKARLLLERAIQNRPDYALAHENLADIYTRLALQSYEKALKAHQPSLGVKLKLDYLQKMPSMRTSRVLTNR